jgi:hypothetical protein
LINQNINIIKNIIFIFSFICLVFQFTISNEFNDYICVFLIYISNIFVTIYCFNNKNISDYPISSNIIFVSYIINIGGVLYFKTITTSLITDKLNLPLNTILYLIIFNFVIIISHYFYTKSGILNIITNNISNFFLRNKLMTINDNNFLIFLGSVTIILKIFYYDLNATIGSQTIETGQFPGYVKDIIVGMHYFIFAPFLIIFSNKLYNINDSKKYTNFFVIYIFAIIFISMSINNRSLLLDIVLFILFVSFIFFQQEHTKFNKSLLLKLVIILIFFFPLTNFLDVVSKSYLLERSFYNQQSPIVNFKKTLSRIYNYNDTKIEINNLFKEIEYFQSEEYYDNSILNRFNILLVNDNINYVFQNISSRKINEIKQLEINKIISILPQPVINLFDKNFNKRDYLRVSMGSYIYKSYDPGAIGILSIGSLPFSMIHYFKLLWPIYLFFLSILIFVFFDSFYYKKNKFLSPIIIFLFYTTAGSILNIFTSTDISKLISNVVRLTPQTVILYFILYKCYHFLFNKKNSLL